jgi:hypothetical protein
MIRVFARPEAKPVMMLGGEDHPRNTRGLGGANLLTCVQFRWIEAAAAHESAARELLRAADSMQTIHLITSAIRYQ